MKALSPWQFTLYRIVLGLGSAFSLGWAAIAMPGPPWGAGRWALAAIAVILSLLLAASRWRPLAALLLGMGMLALSFARAYPLPASLPGLALAFALLLTAAVPGGEPWSRPPPEARPWRMPCGLWRMALLALAWLQVLQAAFLQVLDPWHHAWWTVGFLLALALLPRLSRPWAWLGLGLFILALTFSSGRGEHLRMLALWAFVFDPRWLPPVKPRAGKLLLAFDGECMVCNRAIRFLATEDRADLLRFVKLQSKRGAALEAVAGQGSLKTMLVQEDGRVLDRSSAALRVARALGGHWRLLAILGSVAPRPLADALYDFIAAHRYQWFGKAADSCELPTPELLSRLVDGDAEVDET